MTQELNAGRDVVLVLHSYAAMPGAEALNQLIKTAQLHGTKRNGQGSVKKVIFVATFEFPAGLVFDAKEFIGADDPNFRLDVSLSFS